MVTDHLCGYSTTFKGHQFSKPLDYVAITLESIVHFFLFFYSGFTNGRTLSQSLKLCLLILVVKFRAKFAKSFRYLESFVNRLLDGEGEKRDIINNEDWIL